MNYDDKWEIIEKIGEGGQGKVFRVFDKSIKKETDHNIVEFLSTIHLSHVDKVQSNLDEFFNLVYKRLEIQDISNHKALKVLHKPLDARENSLSKDRIRNELKAMHDIQHSNLLKIIEYDAEDKWFVSEFYSNGTLNVKLSQSFGKALYSLKLIRLLVEAVSELHKNKFVHRDIKPENIFISSIDELILGDFGLVFFNDNKHTRISNTFSNVGSRDWMPGWAMSKRIEEVNPSFDVFSLGKVIWSMISGIPVLPLWYFKDSDNNLELLFPKKREMKIVNMLLDKCIVEREKNCIPNANDLLEEIDSTIDKIESKIDAIGVDENRVCKVCEKGSYILQSNSKKNDHNFGLTIQDQSYYLIYVCNHCGNTQLFFCPGGVPPKAWKS